MRVLGERWASAAEAKEVLEQRAKETELGYEQKNALSHLKKFVKLSSDQANQLLKELEAIPALKELERVAIVDFLPTDKDELRAVLHKRYSTLTTQQAEEVIQLVKRHA